MTHAADARRVEDHQVHVEDREVPQALGAIVEQDRGSLPFALIHGEALVACAAWGLGDSGVTAVDLGTEWAGLVDAGEPFVLHDALCPMTPARFIADALILAVEQDTVVVGVVRGGPREEEFRVASPVVLPASVVEALGALPSTDFDRLVEALRARFAVRLLDAPPESRRVTSVDDVRLLEAQTVPRTDPDPDAATSPTPG